MLKQQVKPIKVCIGLISNRGFKSKTVESLCKMVNNFPYELTIVMANEGFLVSENRVFIARRAIEEQCTHVLFVDDDMVFPQDTLTRLLVHHKPIVGVDSKIKCLPLETTVKFITPEGKMVPSYAISDGFKMPDELFKCFAVGTGIMLVDMEVFKQIDEPWFTFELAQHGEMKTGEDVWFCNQARAKGFDIWCDPTINVKHIGDYLY